MMVRDEFNPWEIRSPMCVHVCVFFFFFRANMTIMSSLPTHNVKINSFNMKWVQLKEIYIWLHAAFMSEFCETHRKFLDFFSIFFPP